jgi:hypothetical protein
MPGTAAPGAPMVSSFVGPTTAFLMSLDGSASGSAGAEAASTRGAASSAAPEEQPVKKPRAAPAFGPQPWYLAHKMEKQSRRRLQAKRRKCHQALDDIFQEEAKEFASFDAISRATSSDTSSDEASSSFKASSRSSSSVSWRRRLALPPRIRQPTQPFIQNCGDSDDTEASEDQEEDNVGSDSSSMHQSDMNFINDTSDMECVASPAPSTEGLSLSELEERAAELSADLEWYHSRIAVGRAAQSARAATKMKAEETSKLQPSASDDHAPSGSTGGT